MNYSSSMSCWHRGHNICATRDVWIPKMFFNIPLHLVVGIVAEMSELWMPLVDT